MSFEKQVEALLSIAKLSGSNKRPVTAEDVSACIGLKGNTGGLSNKFFRDTGWIETAGRGSYVASDGLVEYQRHLNIDPEDTQGARAHLVDAMRQSWYWEILEPMLAGGVRQKLALHALARAAVASDHTAQLQTILTWLEWVGLVRLDGESISSAIAPEESSDDLPGSAQETSGEGGSVPHDDQGGEGEGLSTAEGNDAEPASREVQGTKPLPVPQASPVDPAALVSFSFNVRITADDAARLSGEQLQSLLDFAQKLRG